MKFQSVIEPRNSVVFPEFMAERVYMREFRKHEGLPSDLSRWQSNVDDMLYGVDTDGPIYIMIDESYVKAGATHRREGIHIDGYWNPGISAHGGHGGSRHLPSPSGHGGRRHVSGGSSWNGADFTQPEGLILASSLSACVGYVGEFEGPIGEGGDCSHVDLSSLKQIPMQRNFAYAGNVTSLHESVPVISDCRRQLVRLNVPGWTI